MNIELVDGADSEVIGWEIQLGEREGKFFVAGDGAVLFQSPLDLRVWRVGADVPQFRSAATAWNTYTVLVNGKDESAHLEEVDRLRTILRGLGLLESSEAFWSVLLEQASYGHL